MHVFVGLVSKSAGVAWYRYWHSVFLTQPLRGSLSEIGDCVVYAQGPLAAQAAVRARRDPEQRVGLAVHFRTSKAGEWADQGASASIPDLYSPMSGKRK